MSRPSCLAIRKLPFYSACLLCIFAALALSVPETGAATVQLEWNPNTERNFSGYKLYYGIASRNYAQSIVLGTQTAFTLDNLEKGLTYYFAATAYDPTGESSFSNEVSYAVPRNRAPVASDSQITAVANTPGSHTLTAADQDGDDLYFSLVDPPALGHVSITNYSRGEYIYTPNPNATGADSFSFKANDGVADSNIARVTVSIVNGNVRPIAVNDSAIATQGSAILIDALANDSDPDGDVITITYVWPPAHGTATITGGSIRYAPRADFVGRETFTYRISDSEGATAYGVVTVTVLAANHAPVASSSSFQMFRDETLSGRLTATDSDQNPISYAIASNPRLGNVSVTDSSKGDFVYTPNPGVTGEDSFTFFVNDGRDNSQPATVTISIDPVVQVLIVAESGLLTAPFVVEADTNARDGAYIRVPWGQGSLSSPNQAGGVARYTFSVPVDGWYYLWGRELSYSARHNSFYVSVDFRSYAQWNTGLNGRWGWDRFTENSSAAPALFWLGAGSHSLRVKQREDGTQLDSILITNYPQFGSETTYCSLVDGVAGDWALGDDDAMGAAGFTSVYDGIRKTNVIQLSGSGLNTEYLLQKEVSGAWDNTSQFILECSFNFAEDFVIGVDIETSSGPARIEYKPLAGDYSSFNGQAYEFGLGVNTKADGSRIVRNLSAEYAMFDKSSKLHKVKMLSVRGSGRIDGVKLREY